MDLFCFASRNEENIVLGVRAKTWAVSTVSYSAMIGRTTKAQRNFHIGARGLLYCNPKHSFTTPFIAESLADPDAVVSDIWPQPWRLPFRIRPLGNLSRMVHMHDAKDRWPVLRNSTQRSVSAAMNITGTTVFVPVQITDDDWSIILDDLATEA